MGEALITRRDGGNKGFEIIENAFSYNGERTMVAGGLDFNKYDYLCHIVTETTVSPAYSDTYIIKGGTIVEEYHAAHQDEVYASITITTDETRGGIITAKAKYSNSTLWRNASLLMILH